MKKITLLLFMVMFLSGCGTNDFEYSPMSLALPKLGTYFCPVKDYDGSYLLPEDIFDASEKCESWKTDFWKENAPNAYKDCLNKKKVFVERFQQNTCVPVLKKAHNVGKSGCLIEVIEKYNKVIKYSCYGPDIPSAIKAIKTKYSTDNQNKS